VRRKVHTLIVVCAVLGGMVSSAAAPPDRVLLMTLRGDATAARSGPVDYREAGSWMVRWLVPRSQLAVGRRFLSTSAVVLGTTSARYNPATGEKQLRGVLQGVFARTSASRFAPHRARGWAGPPRRAPRGSRSTQPGRVALPSAPR
jgi:hypothetical protein